jgi:alpha-amylase/alpha-mannosidase (GH57 family)
MSEHSFCIHAHFYQPPREDPLTGIIPPEAGAAPYSNWNERIHAECYRPNAELRNFEQISFNLGPTLGNWMQSHDARTYSKIIQQEQANYRHHNTGNAIAQAYNHTILPLASTQDKETQVAWGIADFQHRFGHQPEGMWLPETATDYETLEILARRGIKFTILAPWQAESREPDPSEPYRVRISHHQHINIFFYQRELSAKVSFDPAATINADTFAKNILSSHFNTEKTRRDEPQLILVASDGELYGHHQRQRDRFLARLVDGATSSLGIHATYPSIWLKKFPPRQEIRIREQTSWSCHHGINRWAGGCACTPGGGAWKTQLRIAFNRLAEALDWIYLDEVQPFVDDAWLLRNRYIEVMLGKVTLTALLAQLTSAKTLTSAQVQRIAILLEAQRERQRMYTSCGWFFDDFDRIEPKNNVACAAQVVRLVKLATGINLAPSLQADLSQITSARTHLHAERVLLKNLNRLGE